MSAVWVKLLQGSPNSSRFTELGIDKITNLNQSNDIADLRKTLITDVAFRNELQGIDSSKLQVYNNDEDATNQREPIEEDTPLSELIETGKGGRKKTALIVVAPPKPDDVHPEITALRKQLSDISNSSINVGIVVKPAKNVVCRWSTVINTATIDDLKKILLHYFPQYNHNDYLELLFYRTYTDKPEAISDDEDLRRILKVVKTQSMTKLIISLGTPAKSFSTWTFKDVISEYKFSGSANEGIYMFPPFTDIQAAPLNSDLEKMMLDQLINEVRLRIKVLKLFTTNEATRSIVVASFLVAATNLFEKDLYLASQRDISGRRGNGPLDFSVHSQKTHSYTLGVTEVKKEDFLQGVAQNIVQLESALTEKKRKRELHDVGGEKELPIKTKSYGIVTDASDWLLTECTLNEDETVSYRMTHLKRAIVFNDNWQDGAKFIFERLVWLWSRMRDEIPARERYYSQTNFLSYRKRPAL
ncbi:hypothetical protein BDF19DRAFT_187408 [Syncephalis fuscata]|nr:hypothetical protein BDF19DRAFT_187408 [Syncephalis fuscata]